MIHSFPALRDRAVIIPAAGPDVTASRLTPFLHQVARSFAAANALSKWELLRPDATFHPGEFDQTGGLDMGFFYRALFGDITRGKDQRLVHLLKIGFCLDGRACANKCGVTERKYAEFRLGSRLVGVVIHITIEELYDAGGLSSMGA